jgi:perosamine synthetase
LYANPVFTGAPVYGTSRYPLDRDYRGELCPNAERLIQHTLVVLPWNEAYTKVGREEPRPSDPEGADGCMTG